MERRSEKEGDREREWGRGKEIWGREREREGNRGRDRDRERNPMSLSLSPSLSDFITPCLYLSLPSSLSLPPFPTSISPLGPHSKEKHEITETLPISVFPLCPNILQPRCEFEQEFLFSSIANPFHFHREN
jgi:hypothetical protein